MRSWRTGASEVRLTVLLSREKTEYQGLTALTGTDVLLVRKLIVSILRAVYASAIC
jgi:hypothetical protein